VVAGNLYAMKHSLLLFFLLAVFYPVRTQDTIIAIDSNKLTLFFAGDIMGHDPQIEGAYDAATGKYNYETTFRYIKEYIQSADISIGNLEVTFAGPPYKGYPQFSSPDELAQYITDAGFDVLAMANNHALDGRTKGFIRTLDLLDTLRIVHFGTYRDSVERSRYYPLIVEKNNIRIALLNYTYGTNGLEIPLPCIINRIDTAQIRIDIERTKIMAPDLILAFMHWGNEYERIENKSQTALSKYLVKLGVDAIIGSHPHVVQPARVIQLTGDTINKYPVVYSLGNFVSNQRAQYKDGGIVAELYISKTDSVVHLDSINYLPYWVWRQDDKTGKSTFYVVPVPLWEKDTSVFNMTEDDIFRLRRFAIETRKHMDGLNESGFYRRKDEGEE